MQIKKLKIYTSNLPEQVNFYSNCLGLECIKQNQTEAQFRIGTSVLILESKASTKPYHFAINIPSNQEFEALACRANASKNNFY